MASLSIPPPDPSATFDSLWDFDEPGEADLPLEHEPEDGAPPVPAEQRDTLLPPVPPPEYVQTMMELGELDDPSDGMPPPYVSPRPPTARQTNRPAEATSIGLGLSSLGLVMASESELLLPTDEPTSSARPGPGSGPGGVQIHESLGPPPLPGRIAGMNRLTGALPAFARGAPVIPGAPAPRAPSIPPPPPTVRGADIEMMPFDDILDDEDLVMEDPSPPPARARTMPPEPRNRTPSSRGAAPLTHPPKSGGLRLNKTPPPGQAVDVERVTPLQGLPVEPFGELFGALLEDQPSPQEQAPPDSTVDALRVMQVRFEARNYPGALVLAESILLGHPAHPIARRCAESCREMLAEKYLSRIGGRNCIPRAVMPPGELHNLALDHRAGFLLSFIDGAMSVDEVLDVSSMPELDALRIMFELQEQGAIAIEPPARRPGRRG